MRCFSSRSSCERVTMPLKWKAESAGQLSFSFQITSTAVETNHASYNIQNDVSSPYNKST